VPLRAPAAEAALYAEPPRPANRRRCPLARAGPDPRQRPQEQPSGVAADRAALQALPQVPLESQRARAQQRLPRRASSP
jgi:hypothetical protein